MIRSFFGWLVVGVAFLGVNVAERAAMADIVRYHVDVNLSTLMGQPVTLFFAASGYNTGPGSAIGNVATVTNFTTNGTLQPPGNHFGLASGELSSTVLLPFNHDNGSVNARAQYDIVAVLATTLSFDVALQGDQLEATKPVPYAGFEFTIFQGGFMKLLDPSGFASAEAYQVDGVLVHESNAAITMTLITVVPESGRIALVAGIGIATVIGARRWFRRG